MSFLAQYPGRWAAGALAVIGTSVYLYKPPAPREGSPISLTTTGVSNIEKAYTNSGATPSHTPAYGGTPLGDKDDVALKDNAGTGSRNKKSPTEQDGMGTDQRPASHMTKVEEAFNETNLGSKKGK